MFIIIFFAFIGCLISISHVVSYYYKPKFWQYLFKGFCGLFLGAIFGFLFQILFWIGCLGASSAQEVDNTKECIPVAIEGSYLIHNDYNGKYMYYIKNTDGTIASHFTNRSDTTIIPVKTKEEIKIIVTEYKFKPWVFSWLTILPCIEYDTIAYITPQIIPGG